jgi:hypothetical protein
MKLYKNIKIYLINLKIINHIQHNIYKKCNFKHFLLKQIRKFLNIHYKDLKTSLF